MSQLKFYTSKLENKKMWKTQEKHGNSSNINLAEIDALRNDPSSAKAQACKEKIVKTIIHDSATWKQLQKEMQGTNLHTNVGLSFILNGEVLEKIGLQLFEKQNENMHGENTKCEGTPSKVRANIYKRESGSFESIKTSMKSLEQCDEFMSNMKGILRICRGSAKFSSSFSESTTDKTVTPARKNSFITPRSMSLNAYQQMSFAPSLNTSKNLYPGRRSSSYEVERRTQNVATKARKQAYKRSDEVHLRALLQHAVGEASILKQNEAESEQQPIIDVSQRKTQVPCHTAKDTPCTNPESMAGTKKMADAALSVMPEATDRRRNSGDTDDRLRYGSSIILQNFSEMNLQQEVTKPRRKSSREWRLEKRMPNPKRCQATAA